jgi:hypothetical protein
MLLEPTPTVPPITGAVQINDPITPSNVNGREETLSGSATEPFGYF